MNQFNAEDTRTATSRSDSESLSDQTRARSTDHGREKQQQRRRDRREEASRRVARRRPPAAAATGPQGTRQKQYEAMFLFPPARHDRRRRHARPRPRHHRAPRRRRSCVIKKWDERKLAYEINGQKRGTYIIAYFTGPGAAVGAIERDVNLSEDVLRVLVTNADHLNQKEMEAVEPQPIQPREERPAGTARTSTARCAARRDDRGRRPRRRPSARAARKAHRARPVPARQGLSLRLRRRLLGFRHSAIIRLTAAEPAARAS